MWLHDRAPVRLGLVGKHHGGAGPAIHAGGGSGSSFNLGTGSCAAAAIALLGFKETPEWLLVSFSCISTAF